MMDLLRDGPLTVGDLATALPELSRFAVMQHLGRLTDAGLVVSRKEGRSRFNFLNPVPIQQVYERWVSQYTAPFAAALVSLKNDLEANQRPGDERPVSRTRPRAKGQSKERGAAGRTKVSAKERTR
jgi:DNA-binding transcriptional ArsR family regulator